MPKPYVHLVPPPLSVALDARMTGNETRFVRSGCRPNAVLRPVLCSSQQARNSHLNGEHAVAQENDDTGVLKFAIYALRDLKACEEVVLGWEWDDGERSCLSGRDCERRCLFFCALRVRFGEGLRITGH